MGASGRFVYDFDEPSDGGRELLGGKGVGLAEMTQLGVPGPGRLHDHDRRLPRVHGDGERLPGRARARSRRARRARSRRRPASASATRDDPLLVSVRSGAAVSMPGMMDTILNLGLNDEAVEGLARAHAATRASRYDSYRRLIQMYGEVVDGIDGAPLRARARRR